MGPRNAYKDMLDDVVSLISCFSMNLQNQLEQMANETMFARGCCCLTILPTLVDLPSVPIQPKVNFMYIAQCDISIRLAILL
jgi:hypothetical protein